MDRKIHLCTMFDSHYLDKGLVLYRSLERVCDSFVLYIFAFDQTAYEVLTEMGLDKAEVISLEQFETEELLQIKGSRSRGEYCWTCTPVIIEYVLDQYQADCCTYIDADLFFYQSPQILLEEFWRSGKSVGLVEHRFPDTYHGRLQKSRSGKYCVQFNTFVNDKGGRDLLKQWRQQCIAECSLETCGDQRYLTDWGEKYEQQVHEYQHLGGGVAPWNLPNYKIREIDQKLYVVYKGRRHEMIFYHFQGVRYSDDGRVHIGVTSGADGGLVSHKAIKKIYYPYLYQIEIVRNELKEKYFLEIYEDGVGRKFKITEFNFKKFMESFWRRLRTESLRSAIDLVFRVLRKKNDIIDLGDVRDRKGC